MKTWKAWVQTAEFQRLWHSVEVQHDIKGLLLLAGLIPVICLLFALRAGLDGLDAGVSTGIVLVVFLPFLVWELYRLVRMFRKLGNYTFTEVTLGQPQGGSHWYPASYFIVRVKDRDGDNVIVKTHRIFSVYPRGSLSVANYVRRKVTVGYNNTTGNVIVIG